MTELLVSRRRRLIRDELASVAIELFAEHGFENVTVDEIAVAAGMSPRTFFRYFASKDEVVLDYERRLRQRLIETFRARPASEGAVHALRDSYIATSHVEPGDRKRILRYGRILEVGSALRARADGERIAEDSLLIELVAERLNTAPDDQRARVIVTAMAAVAATEFRVWVDDDGKGNPADRIAQALSLIEGGLAHLDTPSPTPRRKK